MKIGVITLVTHPLDVELYLLWSTVDLSGWGKGHMFLSQENLGEKTMDTLHAIISDKTRCLV